MKTLSRRSQIRWDGITNGSGCSEGSAPMVCAMFLGLISTPYVKENIEPLKDLPGIAVGSGNSIPDYVSPDRYARMNKLITNHAWRINFFLEGKFR